MPRGDRTGPNGMGAMTGWGAGYCAGFGAPGYADTGAGRGCGRGRGGGLGRGFGGGGRYRNRAWATGRPGWMRFGGYGASPGAPVVAPQPEPASERQALKRQAEVLESELAAIQKRIAELDAGQVSD